MAGGYFGGSDNVFSPGVPIDPNIIFKNRIDTFLKKNVQNYKDFLIKYDIAWVSDSEKKHCNSKSYILLKIIVKESSYIMYNLCGNSILSDIKEAIKGDYNLALEVITKDS